MYILLVYKRELSKNDYLKTLQIRIIKKPQKEQKKKKAIIIIEIIIVTLKNCPIIKT